MKNVYHSILFVPAITRMLSKIALINADAMIIDLEDAILSNEKDKALAELCCFLEKYSYDKDIFIRVNPDRVSIETEALNQFPISGYMLPKTNSIEDICKFHKMIHDKKLFVLIESVEGIMNVQEIAASECVDMLAFGAEDYTAGAGIRNDEEFLVYPKSKIVLYAKAYGKPVYDTISLNIDDSIVFEKRAQKSKDYGFDGKLAIHPMQVDIINSVYRKRNKAYYQYILDEYNKCGKAIMTLDGEIYEKPHIERIKQYLQED